MYLALDTETDLVRQGLKAPPLICLSWAEEGRSGVVGRARAQERFEAILTACLTKNLQLIGHNIAYDMTVLAYEYPDHIDAIFEIYNRGLIHDTMLREKLISLHDGTLRIRRYSLAECAKRYLSQTLEKEDTFRLRYNELRLIPVGGWPPEAVDYAILDAETTLKVFKKQDQLGDGIAYPKDVLYDATAQAKYAFAFQLMCARGMMADPEAIKGLKRKFQTTIGKLKRQLVKAELMTEKGTKRLQATRDRVAAALENPLKTEKGHVSTEASQLMKTNDKNLHALVDYTHTQKMLSTYVTALEEGNFEFPITPRMNTILETGRTSMSAPNLQNLPRKDGIRECLIPRPGYYFCIADYDTAELRSLAQACITLLGRSEMAKVLNAGRDPHIEFAAAMLGISVKKAIENKNDPEVAAMRQRAKAANFGFPGGMGIQRFVETQAKFGAVFTEDEARKLRDDWFKQWPEMIDYFQYMKDYVLYSPQNPNNLDVMKSLVSGRYRGGLGYCDAANNPFQALTADGAKAAVYVLTEQMYATPLLRGCHIVNFIHDEVIVEVPKPTAHHTAKIIVDIMCQEMNMFTPDVPAAATPCLVERWYKDAKPVFEKGKLVPWQPENAR